MLTLKFRAHTGKLYDLFAPDAAIGVPQGGLKLSANVTRTTQEALGRPGTFAADLNFGEMTGSLTTTIDASRATPKATLEEIYLEWLNAHSFTRQGTLIAGRDNLPQLDRSAEVKLAQHLPNPDIVPENTTEMEVEAQLVAEYGAWFGPWKKATGSTFVENTGQVPLTYRVRWKGEGGRVILPSAAYFTLPPTTTERILYISDDESCMVERTDGTPDRRLWKAMAGAVLPEPIAVGDTRAITVPAGATLEWRLGYAHPWG